jgi:hypothetical protein
MQSLGRFGGLNYQSVSKLTRSRFVLSHKRAVGANTTSVFSDAHGCVAADWIPLRRPTALRSL